VTICLILEKLPHKGDANATSRIVQQFMTNIGFFSKKNHIVLGGAITDNIRRLPASKFHYVPYYNITKRGVLYILAHVLYLIFAFFKTCKAIRQDKAIRLIVNIGAHWSSGLVTLLTGKILQRCTIIHVIGSVKTPLIFFKSQSKNAINLLIPAIRKILATIENIVFKFSDAIITVTPLLSDLYKSKYAHKMFTIPWGLDTSVFSPKKDNIKLRQKHAGQKLLLYVGRLSVEKGLPYLFRALRSVILHFPNIKLLVIGEGHYRNTLKKIVEQLNLKTHVRFLGFKNKYEIVEYLSIADIFVLPSLTEYTPNAILEAMACGVPVIATRVGGVPYIIKEDFTGKLVSPRSQSELAKAILLLIKNDAKRKKLADEALNEIRKKYTVEVFARRYKDVFRFLETKSKC
jgi:glycosyltransferase involved in cell wall biosynthesis